MESSSMCLGHLLTYYFRFCLLFFHSSLCVLPSIRQYFFSSSWNHSNAKRIARRSKPPGWKQHFTRFRCVHCCLVGVLRFIGRIFIFIGKHISVLGCGVYAYFDFIFCFFWCAFFSYAISSFLIIGVYY